MRIKTFVIFFFLTIFFTIYSQENLRESDLVGVWRLEKTMDYTIQGPEYILNQDLNRLLTIKDNKIFTASFFSENGSGNWELKNNNIIYLRLNDRVLPFRMQFLEDNRINFTTQDDSIRSYTSYTFKKII